MNRLHVRLLVAGAVLLLALLTIWLGSQLQRYEDVVEHGPAPQARSNDYLAAELFLRDLGLQVARHDGIAGLETLPNSGQTLLLLGERRNMTPRQTERLLDWAAAGGHLVVVAERLWDEKTGKSGDLLLDRLNLQQYSTRDLDEEAQSPQSSTCEQHPQFDQAVPGE